MLCCWAHSLAAQSQGNATFRLTVQSDTFGLNDVIPVCYTLENGDVMAFQTPAFSKTDFELLSSPQTSNSTSIINGVMSKSISYTYYVRPKRMGVLTLPAAYITSDGVELEANEKQIVVVETYKRAAQQPFGRDLGMNPFGNMGQMGDIEQFFNNPNFFNFSMPQMPDFPNMNDMWKEFDKMFEQQFNITPVPAPNTPAPSQKAQPKTEPKIYKL